MNIDVRPTICSLSRSFDSRPDPFNYIRWMLWAASVVRTHYYYYIVCSVVCSNYASRAFGWRYCCCFFLSFILSRLVRLAREPSTHRIHVLLCIIWNKRNSLMSDHLTHFLHHIFFFLCLILPVAFLTIQIYCANEKETKLGITKIIITNYSIIRSDIFRT